MSGIKFAIYTSTSMNNGDIVMINRFEEVVNMKKAGLIIFVLSVGMFLLTASASALTLDVGSPLLMIDGTGDSNTTVTLTNINITLGYGLGYYLNYGSSFNDLGTALISTTVGLNGGDVVDFALYDDPGNDGYTPGDTLYTLSGDLTDGTYSVAMGFFGDISAAQAQQPDISGSGIDTYWQYVYINWSVVPGFTLSASTEAASYDGIIPVPEPGTLMLLGSGLIAVAVYARRSKA